MNVPARLEFELAYDDSAGHRFNHYTTRTSPLLCSSLDVICSSTALQRHNNKDAMTKTQEDFFIKIFTSHFIARVRKGCSRFACERELETEYNWNILTPNLCPSALCLSRSLDAQLEAQRPLCWVMAFFMASYQHLLRTSTHQGPKAPSAWCGFSYHISSITPSDLQLNWRLTSVLTALYYNSTPTRSPTRSLKSNV